MPPKIQAPTVEIAMDHLDSDRALFDEAIEAIHANVPEVHQQAFRHYANGPLLLEDLDVFCNASLGERRRLLACKTKFALFVRSFMPYFDLLAVCVQTRPDQQGWFWGLTNLLFKTGSSYILLLEKIADLFESVAHVLPDYQELSKACKHQPHHQRQVGDSRLSAFLSYAYADIVQFSLESYSMLLRHSHGVTLRHVRLTSRSPAWRPLDSRFTQLEARLLRHKIWLEGELGKSALDYATIAQHRRDYIEFLDKQAEDGEDNKDSDLIEQRMAKRMRRVDRIRVWLASGCTYRDLYEHRLRQRHPNTCTWFLENEKYSSWRNIPFRDASADDLKYLEEDWQNRILFVQAAPCFGKSFLSGAVIDHLAAVADDLSISDDQKTPSTVFYHFNSAHSYCIHPDDAFRALADQLVYHHRHDRSTLSAVSLVMRKTPSMAKASSDDVLSILALLLRQHPTFIVIDGVDECSDVGLLLQYIPQICRRSDTRVVLFSRPNITIPLDFHKWPSDGPNVIVLQNSSVERDVETFLSQNLHELADQGYFGISMNRSLIPLIAKKARGNFLWASLLLKYMQSPLLTPDQRGSKLANSHELEGLDSIYGEILLLLDRKTDFERRFIAGVFRWLTLSIHRLCIPALQTALAVSPGQFTSNATIGSTLTDSIPQLTCGLVEVTECSVVFTHKSVKDYLQLADYNTSEFSLHDESVAHAHLAASCVSYLAFDVPKRPLGRPQPYTYSVATPSHVIDSGTSMRTNGSGDSGYKSVSSASESEYFSTLRSTSKSFISPLPPLSAFDAELPFLRYASLCWPIHLTRALAGSQPHPESSTRRSPESFNAPWLTSLSTFLTDRMAVTVWVEASWRYSLPPNLSRLVPLLENLKSRTAPATIEGRELRWVVHGIRELSEALNELKDEYGTTLRENPSLIWQWRGSGVLLSQGGRTRNAVGTTSVGKNVFKNEQNGRTNGVAL